MNATKARVKEQRDHESNNMKVKNMEDARVNDNVTMSP